MRGVRTMGALLRRRAEERPDAVAHAFLEDGEREVARWTYAQLDARASAVAAALAREGAAGERALLLFPPGLDFISAFFGCLSAGVVAVPAALPAGPDAERGLRRLAAIARDCGATRALTTRAVADAARGIAEGIPELASVRWLAADELSASGERWDPVLDGELAFLQYTSGSTRTPAGVRVTHANLLHNLRCGDLVERNDAESVSLSWLPVHHDMGLIEGTLLPVYGGYPAYLMAPAAFLQRPARWLEAIGRCRATNSGGPNFAYELCVRKVTGEARQALDLSSWRVAYNGSEPIRAETLERFHAAFSPRGLRRSALHPVYGLAEATLIVSGIRTSATPTVLEVDPRALERGEVRIEPMAGPVSRLVGAGGLAPEVEVRIANPESGAELGAGRVGEIWLKSPSVAGGYWRRPEETVRAFHARLASGDGPFLRTGDLGFLHRGELFVAGRLKDLVIIRGRNLYPQDLERTAEAIHPAVRPGCSTAFAVSREEEEQLAVVAEIDARKLDRPIEDLGAALRTAIAAEHGVAPAVVCLVAPHAVPKTSSGKVQRRACREALARGELQALWRWEAPATSAPGPAAAGSLLDWLRAMVASQLGVGVEAVSVRRPLSELGLGSLDTLTLLGALSERTGRQIGPETLTDSLDLEGLAAAPGRPSPRGVSIRQMREDALLADDIQPAPEAADPAAPFLLTGATGFLGAHLLHDLLERSPRDAVCLVRAATSDEAALRVRRALEDHALWSDAYASRIRCVTADLGASGLGLKEWDALARDTSEIFHAAAAVNWIYPYDALRAVNVEGTRQLLRLACSGRAKPFHFVSSQLVCYGSGGPRREVTEADDFLDEIGGLHLGYAQTKCVAERLVRIAGSRGLAARVYRPPFLLGSSRSGRCSTEDFVAALIKGCVQLGSAPDLDWDLDCCPVDFMSALIADASAGPATVHPPLPKARHWRECVLWMNLYGHRVKLRPFAEWRRDLERGATRPDHALFFLRPFFLEQVAGGHTRPELYETPLRNPVSSAATRAARSGRLEECPRLEAPLLERYFTSWAERGYLPRVERPPRATSGVEVDRVVEQHLGRAERLGTCGTNSITGELTAWKHARGTGLFRYRVGRGTVVVKAKPSDAEVLDVAASVADQCSQRLGDAVRRHASLLGFDGCQLRELQIYAQRDPRFTEHAPAVRFIERDDARGRWILGLEDLQGRTWSAEASSAWGRAEREAAVRGLAALHGIGFPRGWPELRLASERTAERMAGGAELWAALEEHARPFFTDFAGEELSALHRRLIASLDRWWRPLDELPRTLIHHDFNTRNIALRRTERGPRLCAYDWELATVGLPQRDLVELLAFTLGARASGEEIDHLVELHRRELERASGQRLDPSDWAAGLTAALGDLLVTRLSLYTMVHRFQRQAFLPDVVRTWARLHAHLAAKGGRRTTHARVPVRPAEVLER